MKRSVLALLALVLISPLLMGATEINIGVNNTVNTGKIVGGNCLQGNNKLTKKQIAVSSFRNIAVDGVFLVNVSCGKQASLAITADDNLHSLISAVVKDGTLRLSSSGSYCTSHSFVAEVSLSELSSVSATGSSELAIECTKTAGGRLTIDLHDATSMKVSGQVEQLHVTVQESSELDAYGLTAQAVTVKASDAATARLTATHKLIGQATEASTVTYRGRPKTVNVDTADASECSPDE
jgi:hypothetical protein